MEQQEDINNSELQDSAHPKKEMIQYPSQEKGTLNNKITEVFAGTHATTIDFSAMPANDPQLRGINWGAAGQPATVGLGQHGYEKSPQQLLQLQKRQEKLLSKSATQLLYQDRIVKEVSIIIIYLDRIAKVVKVVKEVSIIIIYLDRIVRGVFNKQIHFLQVQLCLIRVVKIVYIILFLDRIAKEVKEVIIITDHRVILNRA
ncbi:MAG: hypothetical protein EZS28_024071 [Streblomastix strix]|uniref:Uncharacterized protein n=1 Tax=Streblomastix strix TaxID=222440 RepID=A0A5J4VD94_9EUKA|nr:MAG: hypothetical protein EZS28_024071 [Streblomastix strix]